VAQIAAKVNKEALNVMDPILKSLPQDKNMFVIKLTASSTISIVYYSGHFIDIDAMRVDVDAKRVEAA
jgi:hypothetical protein